MLTLSILATLVALLAVACSKHRSTLRFFAAGLITFFLVLLISYFSFPTFGWRFAETWLLAILGGLIGFLFGMVRIEDGNEDFEPRALIPIGTLIVVSLSLGLISSSCFNSGGYRNVIGTVEVKQRFAENIPLADTKHIRLVSAETAHTIAKKALGQQGDGKSLGSLFNVDFDHGAVQEVRGELWWIFPLDFASDFASLKDNVIPGYVRVSAQDPNREAVLVTEDTKGQKFNIKYTPEAVFGDNLDRRVYNALPWANRDDVTFEVDEDWRPYYTYGVMAPTIGFGAEVTTGIIIADPQTGTCEYKANKDIPSWVDRVRPMKQALEQITYWGDLVHGYWNFSNLDRVKPVGDLWLIKLGNHLYWSVGITSDNSKDDSILGLMLINARMGQGGAEYYPMKGTTEDGAARAVNGQLGANAGHWSATHPTPYNIYGKATWVIPVVSRDQFFFQKVALVSMENINTIVIESDLNTALEAYRQKLASDGNGVAASGVPLAKKSLGPVHITRTGDTIVSGNKTFFFVLEGQNGKLFSTRGTDEHVRIAPVVRVGDSVTITFLDTDEAVVAIESLSLQGMQLVKSPIQKTFEVQQKVSKEADAVIKDGREAEAQIENMTPEKKQEMLRLLREKQQK